MPCRWSWRHAYKAFADCAQAATRLSGSTAGCAPRLDIEMPSTPPRLLRISTEMLPERERFSAFREEFARRVLMMDVIDHSDGRPRIDVTFMPLGPVAVGRLSATPAEFIRHQRHLKDRSDGFILQIVEAGPIHFTHVGEERAYDPGWAHFVDQERPLRALGPGQARIRNIAVQPAALKTLVPHPEDLAGHALHPGPALSLLDGYLQSLAGLADPLSADLASLVGGHLLDLIAAALGPAADAAELVAARRVKAARLQAILAEIAGHYAEPEFDLDDVARTLGLSRRYLQRLLEETGKSFTEHIAERRLQRAHAKLTDPRSFHLRIIDIVLATGFGDVSHFNRLFRRRFGDAPSGLRPARAP